MTGEFRTGCRLSRCHTDPGIKGKQKGEKKKGVKGANLPIGIIEAIPFPENKEEERKKVRELTPVKYKSGKGRRRKGI